MQSLMLHRLAQCEIQRIYRYYQIRAADAANRFRAELNLALQRIQNDPLSFPVSLREYRFLKVKRFPYVVPFEIRKEFVLVLAVAHAKRRPGYWMRRS